MAEYVRQMPDAVGSLTRAPSATARLNIDLPLLLLLLLLTV